MVKLSEWILKTNHRTEYEDICEVFLALVEDDWLVYGVWRVSY